MSNSLAIATVSATLAALITESIKNVVDGASVELGRPQATPTGEAGRSIQLCLYQILPNAALRNTDLPTRKSDGKICQKPTAALDLHYLLAFYGDEKKFETQRMLGAVVGYLHANPTLLRTHIKDTIDSWSVGNSDYLKGSNLDQAIEQVKLTQLSLSLEELSKLWSVFFQTPFALCVAYHASVVLIETDSEVNSAPPVLQRGQNDRGVNALLGAFPQLEKIHISFAEDAVEPGSLLHSRALPSLPNAFLGMVLNIQGQHLQGNKVTLRFIHPLLGERDVVILPEDRTDMSIRFILPTDLQAQTDWAAGVYSLTAHVERDGKTHTTNQLSLNLATKITGISPANPVPIAANTASLTFTVSPQVLLKQAPVLLIGDRQIPAEALLAASDKVDVVITDAKPINDATPVYLRVDGVDSLPIARIPNPPRFVFDDSQKVALQ